MGKSLTLSKRRSLIYNMGRNPTHTLTGWNETTFLRGTSSARKSGSQVSELSSCCDVRRVGHVAGLIGTLARFGLAGPAQGWGTVTGFIKSDNWPARVTTGTVPDRELGHRCACCVQEGWLGGRE